MQLNGYKGIFFLISDRGVHISYYLILHTSKHIKKIKTFL